MFGVMVILMVFNFSMCACCTILISTIVLKPSKSVNKHKHKKVEKNEMKMGFEKFYDFFVV